MGIGNEAGIGPLYLVNLRLNPRCMRDHFRIPRDIDIAVPRRNVHSSVVKPSLHGTLQAHMCRAQGGYSALSETPQCRIYPQTLTVMGQINDCFDSRSTVDNSFPDSFVEDLPAGKDLHRPVV